MRKKEIGIYTLVFIVISAIVLAVTVFNTEEENSIKRDFQKTNIKPGEIVTITLDVSVINDKTFYAIEEYVPEGWTIINDGGGASDNPNILKWAVFQNTKSTKYTYDLQAPNQEGDYTTLGVYTFEGFTETKNTEGDNIIKVSS